jgi:hypothetical protein
MAQGLGLKGSEWLKADVSGLTPHAQLGPLHSRSAVTEIDMTTKEAVGIRESPGAQSLLTAKLRKPTLEKSPLRLLTGERKGALV